MNWLKVRENCSMLQQQKIEELKINQVYSGGLNYLKLLEWDQITKKKFLWPKGILSQLSFLNLIVNIYWD